MKTRIRPHGAGDFTRIHEFLMRTDRTFGNPVNLKVDRWNHTR